MNTNILVMVAICAIIFLIYLYFKLNNRKIEAANLLKLKGWAEIQNCHITNYERWNRSIIGIDRENRYLFVIQRLNEQEAIQKIDLSPIVKCWVNESSRSVKLNESHQKVVDKIELILCHKDRSKEDVSVEFYNSTYDSLYVSKELQVAKNWEKIISETIVN